MTTVSAMAERPDHKGWALLGTAPGVGPAIYALAMIAKMSLRTLRPRGVLLPVVLASAYLVVVTQRDARTHSLVPADFAVFAILAVAVAVSYRLPIASMVILTAVLVLQLAEVLPPPTAPTWWQYLAAPLCAVLVALRPVGAARLMALPAGMAVAVLAAANLGLQRVSSDGGWTEWYGNVGFGSHPLRTILTILALASFGIYTVAWGLGISVSTSVAARLLKETREDLAERDFALRLSLDRTRISREIHDALAHSLAVIVSQSEGALAVRDTRPEVADRSLRNISEVSRSSLIDIRRLIESIQDEDTLTARPSLAEVPSLIRRMQDAGMSVGLEVTGGVGSLGPAKELTAFRIIQESLTNALKHSGARAQASVNLSWSSDALDLKVTSSGDHPLVEAKVRSTKGVGVEGMRERARLAGGRLSAGPVPGGFVVEARLPVGSVGEVPGTGTERPVE